MIVLTHGHADHASDVIRLHKETGAKVLGVYELINILKSEGLKEDSAIAMNTGGSYTFEGVKITLTQSYHSNSYDTKQGAVYAGQPCGVVIRDGKNSFYHAGDTALFSDLNLIGDMYKPVYAFLPIGDLFTMGPKAAATAASWLRCKTAIPIHYKTFPVLVDSAESFEKECQNLGLKCLELNPGDSHEL